MTTQDILQGVHDWTNGKTVYDISAAHPDGQGKPTPYADLAAALGTGGANIPEGLRKGGMSIKFIQGSVQSSDNKYVQYRYLGTSTDNADFIDITKWAICEDVVQIAHPEYIVAEIDAENKLFEAVKKDGTKYIPGDLEVGGSIINDELEEQIENLHITWEGEDNKLVKFNKILDVSDIESTGDDNTIYIPRDKDAIYLGKRKIAEIKDLRSPKWSASEYITTQESIEHGYPTITQGEDISYSSSDTEVATINQNGEITLLNFGETSIKAENMFGSDSYTLKVYQMELDIPGHEFSLSYSKAIEDNLVKEYKYTEASERGILLKSSGQVRVLMQEYWTSGYISCEGAHIIKFNGLFPSENNNYTGICLYDSNKNFLWAQNLDNLPTVNNGMATNWENYVKSVYVINRNNSSLGSAAYFRFTLFDQITSEKYASAKDQISVQVFYTPVESTLVLGNSITLHDITSDWWGEWGMAASSRGKDFVHGLFKGEYGIWSSNPGKNIYAANLAENFERSTSTTAKLKEVLLNTNLKNFDIDNSSFYSGIWDLVVIRLGENVTDNNSFKSRLIDLLLNITDLMPQIKVIVTGMFWTDSSREAIIQEAVNTAKQGNGLNVTQSRKIKYISINEYDNSTYKETVGHSVFGDDFKMHIIENSGVANHPNDKGMTAIASKIIDNINF